MIPRPPQRRRPDFSLATINIVFLLLLFFLVAGSVVQRSETGVQIPIAADLPLENLPRPLLVLSYGGVMFLDGAPIDPANLVDETREKTARAGTFLNILAERDLPARPLLDVVAQLSSSGIPARIVTIAHDESGSGGGP